MEHAHARLILDALAAGTRLVVGADVRAVNRLALERGPAPERPCDAVLVDRYTPQRQRLPDQPRVAAPHARPAADMPIAPDLLAGGARVLLHHGYRLERDFAHHDEDGPAAAGAYAPPGAQERGEGGEAREAVREAPPDDGVGERYGRG